MNPFDFVSDIRSKKQNLMKQVDYDPEIIKAYDPYLTNKALSFYTDTIFFVNEINQRYHLTKRQQFDFYINIVRPNKRFEKWIKKELNGDLKVIKEYYQCSDKKANEIARVLTAEQIDQIKESLNKGGQSK